MNPLVWSPPTTGQYKIRLVTKVGINHSMRLLTVLTVFSNAQPGKGLRRAAHVFFPAKLLQLADSTRTEKSTHFDRCEARLGVLGGSQPSSAEVRWGNFCRRTCCPVRGTPCGLKLLPNRPGLRGLCCGEILAAVQIGGLAEDGNLLRCEEPGRMGIGPLSLVRCQ
jgi:hypothetical protein